MANVPVVDLDADEMQVRARPNTDTEVLPAEFPVLHSALTFTRTEVDGLGGLHLFRADYVAPAADLHPANVRE